MEVVVEIRACQGQMHVYFRTCRPGREESEEIARRRRSYFYPVFGAHRARFPRSAPNTKNRHKSTYFSRVSLSNPGEKEVFLRSSRFARRRRCVRARKNPSSSPKTRTARPERNIQVKYTSTYTHQHTHDPRYFADSTGRW